MQRRTDNHLKYWGKAGYGAEKMTVHLLPYHCLDCRSSGTDIFKKKWANKNHISTSDWLGRKSFSSMHDIFFGTT